MNNWKLYPGALMEMARVSRVERGRACLLTADKKCLNKVELGYYALWKITLYEKFKKCITFAAKSTLWNFKAVYKVSTAQPSFFS